MMKIITIATHNRSKLQEIQALFKQQPFAIQGQTTQAPTPQETGSTFIENAIIKAKQGCKHHQTPCIADDSGLVVAALNGAPGVRSSRYAGEQATDTQNIHSLLEHTKNFKQASACFVCIAVFMRHENDPTPLIAQGFWEGQITHTPAGKNGFGYDSVFYLPDQKKTAAQLPAAIKNQISHRAKAFQILLKQLQIT